MLAPKSTSADVFSVATIKPCPSAFASEAGRRRRGREAVPQHAGSAHRGRALQPRDAPEQGEERVGDEEEEGERGLGREVRSHDLHHAEQSDGVTEEEGASGSPRPHEGKCLLGRRGQQGFGSEIAGI